MKKYFTFIFLALIVSTTASAQVRVSYSVGYGDYKMDDMNRLLDASLSLIAMELPAGVAITDRFPGYILPTALMQHMLSSAMK